MNFDNKSYIKVCQSKEVRNGAGENFVLEDGRDLAIFRVDQKLYCLSNVCRHQHQPKMYQGFVENGNVICPLHGWTYRLTDGKNIEEGSDLDSYSIIEKDGSVFVEEKAAPVPKWMDD